MSSNENKKTQIEAPPGQPHMKVVNYDGQTRADVEKMIPKKAGAWTIVEGEDTRGNCGTYYQIYSQREFNL